MFKISIIINVCLINLEVNDFNKFCNQTNDLIDTNLNKIKENKYKFDINYYYQLDQCISHKNYI
jgi:hypothetical protein